MPPSLFPILKLLMNHQLLPALRANALYKPFYRLSFMAGAAKCGLLADLAQGPLSFDEIAAIHGQPGAKFREALEAWLHLGVRLGLLAMRDGGFGLSGLARTLARPENDATLALAQEAATLHHKLIVETPMRLRDGRLWNLDDQDGELTTRSSRALETFLWQAMDRWFPESGPVRLLEVGCGSGCYIRRAAETNPSLRALGLELQADAAAVARSNIRDWGLSERVTIETGDIRERAPEPVFDIATLYNNIYYFPVAERVQLLAHLKRFLRPDGFLLLATCCQGGNVGMEVLNLWGAATKSGGRLPEVDEMREQLKAAGYGSVDAISLIPADRFFAFRAGY